MIDEIISFWCDDVGPAGWYRASDAVDREIAERFGHLLPEARTGALDWEDTPRGAFALIVLLDQFPRNLFRESAEAFSFDPLARQYARQAISRNYDLEIDAPQRQFFYLPLEHSEALADQDWAIARMQERWRSILSRYFMLINTAN